MANLLKTLTPLFIFLLAVTDTANSQTTSFTYDFNGEKPTDLTYQGDAHFPTGSYHLRLTKTDDSGNPSTNSVGRVVYTAPVQFWDAAGQVDFETTVKFIITTVNSNPGDGLVFFIAPVGTTIPTGHSGGNFGVFDSSTGKNPSVFAVEFDTYVNPEVDPDYRHVGIDVEYLKSTVTAEVDDSILNQEVTALIEYEEATKVISVTVTAGSRSSHISYVYDLSTVLNQQVQVGLAASTGGAVAVHDVTAWYFTATLVNRGETMGKKEDMKIRRYGPV